MNLCVTKLNCIISFIRPFSSLKDFYWCRLASAMGSKAILVFFCVLSVSQVVLGALWEFGNPHIRGSITIAHNKGYIGALETTRTITISVSDIAPVTLITDGHDYLI